MTNFVSPGVYVIEKDLSQYPTSINPSVVGIVGFANKGPENKATLITSQEQLIKTFGKPSESIEGQGLEGALEILEATNQVYFVRSTVDSGTVDASAKIPIGSCPAICINPSGADWGVTSGIKLVVHVSSNAGVEQFTTPKEFIIPSGTATTSSVALVSKVGGGAQTSKVSIQNIAGSSFLVGAFAGAGAALSAAAFSGADLDIPAECLQALDDDGTILGGKGASTSLKVIGTTVNTSKVSYLVQSLHSGSEYNYALNDKGDVIGNTIEIQNLGGKDNILQVNSDGAAAESYSVSLEGSGNFIEKVINTGEVDNVVSEYIKANIVSGVSDVDVDGLTDFGNKLKDLGLVGEINDSTYNPRFVKFVEGTYNMAGGESGASGTSSQIKAAAKGDPAEKTGVYALDYDILNIGLACVPDINDQDVQNALISLAESSQNFLAVVAPPYGLASVQDAIDWSNGQSVSRTSAINNSYAAIYWPWVKTFDQFDQKDKWFDPAIFGIRQMCFTDSTSESWFAPAGFVRGRLTKPVDVEINVGQGDRDAMYSGGNVINPIVNFVQQGITIFGQRTAQRDPSALDRINVRRLMIIIRKILLNSTRQFVFEPNDPTTWENITGLVESQLDEIARRRGITEFKVICDETTNTPVRIDKGELWCKVLLKPTKSAEIIVFELNLTNQSASL